MTVDVQFGLKLWSRDADLLPAAADLIRQGIFHYVELTPLPGAAIGPFLAEKIPYLIHVPAEQAGVNIADPAQWDRSRQVILEAREWADRLGAEGTILHPGFGRPGVAAAFLRKLEGTGILIENMPKVGISGEPMVGYDRDSLEPLLGGGRRLCLDLNHAAKAAVSLGVDYRAFIRDLMDLSPALFHISDGTLTTVRDEHLPLGSGDYDLRFFRDCIARKRDARVTIETPRSRRTLDEDLANLERFIHS